ncbi:hypothetical protein BCV70DRAFT_202996 [Testicularia cyperi]|uniref:Hydrophobin n=1 Tax=Testicularia cyperi TaxID=1882483 RepID=A0A317XIF1_9BASI|nr:hypothetical protein BCV70DRAFT_202996 [Testicularia cyperi]
MVFLSKAILMAALTTTAAVTAASVGDKCNVVTINVVGYGQAFISREATDTLTCCTGNTIPAAGPGVLKLASEHSQDGTCFSNVVGDPSSE